VALLSGILFAIAFSIKPFWWISFAALFPLLLSLERAGTWKAAVGRITLFSIVFSIGMGYWVFSALVGHYQLPAGMAAAFFILALILPVWLIHLVFALFYRFLNNRTPVFYALVVPCLWVLGDYVKAMIPLLIPWGDIGYALVDRAAYFHMADLGGVHLVSFLVVMFNALLVGLVQSRPETDHPARRRLLTGRAGVSVLLLVLIMAVPFCYGTVRRYLMPAASSVGQKTPAVIVQGNFSPQDRWGGLGFYQRLKTYAELSGMPPDSARGGVIVWPETVLNHPEALTGSFFADLARMLGKENLLIAGGLKREPRGVHNSVYVIDDGRLQRYDKHILLPYAERAPAENDLPETPPADQEVLALDAAMRRHIKHVLNLTNGRVHGPKGAAAMLRINPSTLRNRMKKLGI